MGVVLSPELATQVERRIAAGESVAAVAADYGLLDHEVQKVVARVIAVRAARLTQTPRGRAGAGCLAEPAGTPYSTAPTGPSTPAGEQDGAPVRGPSPAGPTSGPEGAPDDDAPSPVSEPTTSGPELKTCSGCKAAKPVSEFYPHTGTRDGVQPQCRKCNNTRNPTEARLLRTRARTRALAVLVDRHHDEFKQLVDDEHIKVVREHARLATAAAGNPDAATARLKPGPMRRDETDVVQRLDVARCPTCHTHHDERHVCPTCGDETLAKVERVKPYLIRAWAVVEGIGPVPPRGPLPARITAAYFEAHPDESLNPGTPDADAEVQTDHQGQEASA